MNSFTHQQVNISIQYRCDTNFFWESIRPLYPNISNVICLGSYRKFTRHKHALSTQELANPKRSTRKLGGFLFTEHTWFVQFVAIVFSCLFFFGGVHKVRLVFRKITHHKHCNVETTFWHENAAISKRSQHLTNTRILGTFLFWENMRSCGSKRETMRSKEKLMRNNGKQWE